MNNLITQKINIYLLGLGNPDPQFSKTWHNIGKEFIYYFLSHTQGLKISYKNITHIKKINYNQYTTIILHNKIYMNLNGNLICPKIPKKNNAVIIIFYDEISIKIGNIKISPKPSHSHKGVQSIIKHCSIPNILWVKIGINTPIYNNYYKHALKEYVLKHIPQEYQNHYNTKVFPELTENIKHLIQNPDRLITGYLSS